MLLGVGHIGIAVRDLEAALNGLCTALELPIPEIKDLPERGMKVAVVPLEPVSLELIEDYSNDGPLAEPLRSRGSHIHHFCLVSDDLEKDIALLKERGVATADEKPARGLRGKRVAFTTPEVLDGIPIELSEP
jgi:methylmalonyl-CoA/ethylmalonyl-CoA epimerase